MSARGIVVLGMITKMPVPGVIWQTLHYLEGFRRLGYDVTYVEAHTCTPSIFTRKKGDLDSRAATRFLHDLMSKHGFGDSWSFHALHDDGECWGLDRRALERAYASAEVLLNMHGGTEPLPEHEATGRLVFLGTDPCEIEFELWNGREETVDFLEAHCAHFTFGENHGAPDCGLPVSDRFTMRPTRQPIVPDFWDRGGADNGVYTTVGNWLQPIRRIRFKGETHHWSKHVEFQKFLDLPSRTGLDFELALSSIGADGLKMLDQHGWAVRDAHELSPDPDRYRDYIQSSRGEFTVAKDQNVRLRSGRFSDRSATYLAAGRPVVTQDTGFSVVLPTGAGLFGVHDTDEAVAALEVIEGDYRTARRAARDVALEYFDYRVVLSRLLVEMGVEGPRPSYAVPREDPRASAFPESMVLQPLSRWPLKLPRATRWTLLGRPVPEVPEMEGVESVAEGACPDRPPAASIVVVTFDNLPLTRLCLESLLAHTSYPSYEVVVVDNDSADGTGAYLRRLASVHRRVRLILNPSNEGFARACNLGARAAVGDLLVFLNHDTVLAPGWLERLAAHLEDPEVGAVNPVTNRVGMEAEVGHSAHDFGEFLAQARSRVGHHAGGRREVDMLAFFCLALRRSTWDEVGDLDESFGRGLFEDDDYSMRLERAGHRLWCAEDVLVHHFGEASFRGLMPDGTYGKLVERNRRRFEAKWNRPWRRENRSGGGDDGALVKRIRRVVLESLPGGVTVAVVSRGDDTLLEFEDQIAWHFPQQDDGTWASHYPTDGGAAVDQLERLRQRGADYLLLPRTAFWWLEHYRDLSRHLSLHGEEVVGTDDLRLYRLGGPAGTTVPPGVEGA